MFSATWYTRVEHLYAKAITGHNNTSTINIRTRSTPTVLRLYT